MRTILLIFQYEKKSGRELGIKTLLKIQPQVEKFLRRDHAFEVAKPEQGDGAEILRLQLCNNLPKISLLGVLSKFGYREVEH